MKKVFYSLMLLLGISMFLSSCDKISGGGDDVDEGDFDGVWDTQWETNDLFNGVYDWGTFCDENGNELKGYDAEFERDMAYFEISGSLITFFYYDRIVKFDGAWSLDDTGKIKGKEIKRYEYYDIDNKYKFEYVKPHIFIMGINAWDLVSKTKNQMKWKYVLDGGDEEQDLILTRRKK